MKMHDCRGGSFTSPPCGEQLCRSCGPGEEALRRWALKEEDLRALFEDTLEAGTKKLEALAGAKRGTPAFIAAVEWFRHVDADARGYLGNDWHRAKARKVEAPKGPPTEEVPAADWELHRVRTCLRWVSEDGQGSLDMAEGTVGGAITDLLEQCGGSIEQREGILAGTLVLVDDEIPF